MNVLNQNMRNKLIIHEIAPHKYLMENNVQLLDGLIQYSS